MLYYMFSKQTFQEQQSGKMKKYKALKFLQYADDTEIFATTDESINEFFCIIDKYEQGTGAKINVEKTEGLWLGNWKKRTDKPFNVDWKNKKVRVLGIWVGNEDTTYDNFIEQESKIKTNCNSGRELFYP